MALLQILHIERADGATPTPRNPGEEANIVVTGRLGKTPSTADGEAHVEEAVEGGLEHGMGGRGV